MDDNNIIITQRQNFMRICQNGTSMEMDQHLELMRTSGNLINIGVLRSIKYLNNHIAKFLFERYTNELYTNVTQFMVTCCVYSNEEMFKYFADKNYSLDMKVIVCSAINANNKKYLEFLHINYNLSECLTYAQKHNYTNAVTILQEEIDSILPDVKVAI